MFRTTLGAAALLALTTYFTPTSALSCVAFDANFNLFAFGLGGTDYNLGAQSTWTNGQVSKLTNTGRPPFDGVNTQCFLSQYENAVYVIDGDQSNPSDVHIYDATALSWSTQQVTLAGVDPTSLVAILDHDTNVLFALSAGVLYQLDMTQQKAAAGTISWANVGNPSFTTTNYSPVMALAQNHIHFLDVPGSQPGMADIFVIHYAYFQPAAQLFKASTGNTFPVQHGKTASFFLPDVWQEQFAYVPDDGSATYVVDVANNVTTPFPGPSDTSAGSVYTASTSALVQLSSSNTLSFLPYNQNTGANNANAAWTAITISGLPAASSNSSSASGSSTGSSSATSTVSGTMSKTTSGSVSAKTTASGSNTASSSGSSGTAKPNGAVGRTSGGAVVLGSALAAVGLLLSSAW